jgi:hypothetical protein
VLRVNESLNNKEALQVAQTQAILALVEQQRISNLVALATFAIDSDVIIEKKKITVIEHTTSNWKEKGVNE